MKKPALRRPSTVARFGAGLFATDRLRRSPASWTDATLLRVVLRPRVDPPLCDPRLSRAPRRGVVMRNRLALFLLFVALLVVVPALLAS